MPLARLFICELKPSYHHEELHQAGKSTKPRDNQMAKVVWAVKAAKDSREIPIPPGLAGSSPNNPVGRSGEGVGMFGTE